MKVEWTVGVRAVENRLALFAIKSNGNLLSKVHVLFPVRGTGRQKNK